MCRSRYQNQNQNQYSSRSACGTLTQLTQSQSQPYQYRQGCCGGNSKFKQQLYEHLEQRLPGVYHNPTPSPPVDYQPAPSQSKMAALIIGAIGVGAVKLQEKRERKKARRAEWESESVKEKDGRVARESETGSERGYRKSEEARGEAGRSGSVSGEVEGERRVEEAPPSYDEVVGQKGAGRSN